MMAESPEENMAGAKRGEKMSGKAE